MKIYTKTGDGGTTALFGGGRVPKNHPRVGAYGAVDELSSSLGVAIVQLRDAETEDRLLAVQQDLFDIGASLATPPPDEARGKPKRIPIPVARIPEMERWMDEAEEIVEPLRNFILPGGSAGAAALHLSRTICRRAEREVVGLTEHTRVEDGILEYLNRLSDLLFVLARVENVRAGVADIPWVQGR